MAMRRPWASAEGDAGRDFSRCVIHGETLGLLLGRRRRPATDFTTREDGDYDGLDAFGTHQC